MAVSPVTSTEMVRRWVAGPESDGQRVSSEDGRASYTFTDCEMSICRSAQLASYTGIGRMRTVAPSYMGSSDWNKGRTTTAPPPDFTKLLDRPSGTTKKEHAPSHQSLSQASPSKSSPRQHSSGKLGLERSKAVFAAVKQRFDECHNPSNLRWYEGVAAATSENERFDPDVSRSPKGTPINARRRDTPELAHFHERVKNSRSRRSAPVRQTYMQAMDARRATAHFSAPAQARSAVRRPLSAGDVFRMTRQDLECGLVPEALPSPAGPHTRTPPLSSSTYSPAKSTRTVKTQTSETRIDSSAEPSSRYLDLLMLVHGRDGDSWLHDKVGSRRAPFKH